MTVRTAKQGGDGYASLLAELKERIRTARLKALSEQTLGPPAAVLVLGHAQPVPIFQQLARGHPSGRDDVRQIPACLMTFRAADARRDHCERVAALSTVARVGSGTRGPFEGSW